MVGQVEGGGGGEEDEAPGPPSPSPDGGGRLLLASLAAAGVDTRHVAILPATPTGTAVIMVQQGTGENSIVIVGGANAAEGAWLDTAGGALAGALWGSGQLITSGFCPWVKQLTSHRRRRGAASRRLARRSNACAGYRPVPASHP